MMTSTKPSETKNLKICKKCFSKSDILQLVSDNLALFVAQLLFSEHVTKN